MLTTHRLSFLLVVTALPRILFAQEVLPEPKQPVPAEAEMPMADEEPVVVGNLEHKGWSLTGPRGRHYFFGGLAVADYRLQGQRRMVTLQQEEPTLLPLPDEKYLYYRELQSGDRWAIGRKPLSDGRYVVFYQPHDAPVSNGTEKSASPKRKWQEFQRSQLEWPR